MFTGKPRNRSVNVFVCWRASSVVGTTTGHLLAVHRRDEGRPQRDFGLAETDIAAHEAVHRAARRQVVHHHVDRHTLVVGLLVGEVAQNSS